MELKFLLISFGLFCLLLAITKKKFTVKDVGFPERSIIERVTFLIVAISSIWIANFGNPFISAEQRALDRLQAGTEGIRFKPINGPCKLELFPDRDQSFALTINPSDYKFSYNSKTSKVYILTGGDNESYSIEMDTAWKEQKDFAGAYLALHKACERQ